MCLYRQLSKRQVQKRPSSTRALSD
jgi:hypothetical protein